MKSHRSLSHVIAIRQLAEWRSPNHEMETLLAVGVISNPLL
jgi:hypothetical protein